MKKNIIFLLKNTIFWLLTFAMSRAIFLLYNIQKTSDLGVFTTLKTFVYGSRLDCSMSAYFLIALCILLIVNVVFSIPDTIKYFSYLLITFTFVLTFIDVELYKAWRFRLDNTFFIYLKSPAEMSASVESSPVFLLFFAFLIFVFFIIKIYKKYIQVPQNELLNWKEKAATTLLLLVFGTAMIVPLRGGLQQIPINQSSVYFSNEIFANHAAVNVVWNFFDAIVLKKGMTENPFIITSDAECKAIIDSLFIDNQSFKSILKPNTTKPNIVVIAWESLTSKVVGSLGGIDDATPNLNKLSAEGILFTNAFASGDRTDKGIAAILSGYPAQPIASIVQEGKKAEKLPVLSRDFKKNGYKTAFFYGGELDFANLKSYLFNGGFERVISKNDFSKAECSSKWGAFDHIVFERFLKEHEQIQTPFFSTMLTLTSHEPFEIPQGWEHQTYGKKSDEVSRFINSQFYTDAAFGNFIEKAKQTSWWSNTILVVVGDHGARLPESKSMSDNFKTPILLLGGALGENGRRIDNIVSQIDIAATLLDLVKIQHTDYQWSKSLFTKNNFAHCAFKNGFGFFQNDKKFIFDNVGKTPYDMSGDVNEKEILKGKAFQQAAFEDFLRK